MEATNSALVLPSENTEPALSDIHDIRSLVEVPSSWAWLWWVAAVAVTLGLLYLAWHYWKKHRKKKAEEPAATKEPAQERARRELEAALEFLHDPEKFCVLVSQTIRVYLEARFDLHAPERTTEEFLDEVQESAHLNEAQKQSLAEFLTVCDMVKFAKSEPEAYELKQLHDAAIQLVRETEPSLLESTPEPAAEYQS